MATSKDFRVKNGLVVEQDISFGGSFKDLSGNPIELGGGGFEPSLASYQNLATSTNFTFIPSVTVEVDDKYNQTSQGFSFSDSSKYAMKFMDAPWMNWIADNYIQWLPNPNNLGTTDLRNQYKNKNYLMIGTSHYNDIIDTPIGSNKILVGDVINLTFWAVNTNYQVDQYTVQTTVTVEPFKMLGYENYYASFQDQNSGYNFGGNPNRFLLLSFDWIKKSDITTVGALYGLPLYDPGWMFSTGGAFASSYYYGDRGFDSATSYLNWNYLTDHTNIGYGPMGLETMSIITTPVSVATFQQVDWQNVKDNINNIATGSTLPLTHYDASIYNNSEYKLTLSNSNLALSNATQFKKYIGVGSDPVITIGQLKGYETPTSRTLAFTGQLAKKNNDGSLLNYTTTQDVSDSIPGWVTKITNDSNLLNTSGYVLKSNSDGPYFGTIGFDTVTSWNPSTNAAIQLYNSVDSNYSTLSTNTNGAIFTYGGIGVRKTLAAGSIKTGSFTSYGGVNTDVLTPTTIGAQLSITTGGLKVVGPVQTKASDYKPGDANISSVVGVLNTSTWITGQTIANDLPGGSPLTTNGTVEISDVIPPGATGKSLRVGNSSNNWFKFDNMNAFDIGTQDWTVEAWVKTSDNSTNTSGGGFYDRINFLDLGTTAYESNLFNIRWNWSQSAYVYSNQTGYLLNTSTSPYYIGGYEENSSIGVWRHVAFTKSGNTIRVFINGIQVGSGTTSWTQNLSAKNFFVRGQSYHTFYYNYRLTIGAARYTSNFIPSLESFPLTTTDNLGTILPDGVKLDSGIELTNVSSAPSGNSSTGGYLYVEGGALKYKGSNGTVTTVGAA